MTHPELSNSMDREPAVDFLSLLGRCMGNFKILERVLAMFGDTGWSDLNQFEAAIQASDYPLVVDIAHRFKGAASNVSATKLTKLLIRAEQFGHERNHFELRRLVVELRSEWESVQRFIQVFTPATNSSIQKSFNSTYDNLEKRHACAGR